MAPLDRIFEFTHHESVASLEAPLGRSRAMLEYLANTCDTGQGYTHGYLIVRRKLRDISIPTTELDAVQRHINALIFPIDLAMGNEAHGYIARRSTRTNAAAHVGARYLQKFDITDFFSTITTDQIATAFRDAGFGTAAGAMLSRLVSCRGQLPLGARTSPRVSNLVLREFDIAISAAAHEMGLTYTRYADDLSFSGAAAPDVQAVVESELRKRGFSLNAEKTRSFKYGQPMFVTGLSVSDQNFPRLRKRFKAQLRKEFHFVDKYGIDDHAAMIDQATRRASNRIMGQFHYARSIEPEFAAKLAGRYPEAYRTLIPEKTDDRIERVQRYRAEFRREVLSTTPGTLPMYIPTTELGLA